MTLQWIRKSNVDITWATASEINNAYFDVERSADAESFTSIAKVAGAGNSEITINYKIIDNNPLAGVSYYRLKQVDVDSNFTYSDVVSVLDSRIRDKSGSDKGFPYLITTPSVHIDASGSDVPVIVTVFDISGRMINDAATPPNSDTQIDMSSITQAGVYIIHC